MVLEEEEEEQLPTVLVASAATQFKFMGRRYRYVVGPRKPRAASANACPPAGETNSTACRLG